MRASRLTAVVISCVAFAQSVADDPGGWTKAKWGMTDDSVKAAFPQAAQIKAADPLPARLGLSSFVVGYRKYAVEFLFDKEKHLNTVHLIDQKTLVNADGTEVSLLQCGSCASAAPQNTSSSRSARKKATDDAALAAATEAYIKADLNEQASRSGKDALLSALTEKYGNPSDHKVEPSGMETFAWRFPTTTITLMWFHSQYKQLDSVNLYYGLREKSSLL